MAYTFRMREANGADPAGVEQPDELDTRLSLHKLEILCCVVELGGVTRAAEHMFVAQPVLTAHLRSIEDRLKVKLFVRSGRHLELTEAGERVHAWASETLTQSRSMYRELQGLTDGQRGAAFVVANMSIGSYLLPEILTAFMRERPEAVVSLAIREEEAVIRAIEQGECDFGVVVGGVPPMSDGLESELLAWEDVLLVAAPEGPPPGETIKLKDLRTVPIVGPPHGSVRRTLVDRTLNDLGAPSYHAVLELGHPEALKRAARGGIGGALLFRSAVEEEIARGELRNVPFEDASPTLPIYAVKRKDKRLSALQQQLLDAIRQALAER
jgi:LysR family transcriptional regulator, low CO2-responsive transcriptional regulator